MRRLLRVDCLLRPCTNHAVFYGKDHAAGFTGADTPGPEYDVRPAVGGDTSLTLHKVRDPELPPFAPARAEPRATTTGAFVLVRKGAEAV